MADSDYYLGLPRSERLQLVCGMERAFNRLEYSSGLHTEHGGQRREGAGPGKQ